MRISALLVCLMLLSCSKPLITPFTYANSYQEVKLSDDLYELHIQGPYNVSAGLVREFFLCRAAELTLQNGGKFFVILRDKREREKGLPLSHKLVDPKDVLLDRIDIPFVPYLGHDELEKQLKFSNTGTIKICHEMPMDAPFYDAARISANILPNAQKVKRYDEHKPLFKRLIMEIVELTEVI